ncbi:MAG: LEA type 2 family protein [Bacteroidia bacterium]
MRYSLVIFLLALLCSCSGFKELSVSDIQSLNVQNIDSKGATFKVGVTIKNPNSFKIKVTAGELNVKLGKRDIGKAVLQNKIVIPAKSEKTHEFEIATDLSTLGLAAIPMIAELIRSKKTSVTLDGYVKGRALFVSRKIDIKRTDIIDISGK